MKIVNIILGLGTAIIVGALLNLGIAAFHPGPVAPEYNAYVKPMPVPYPPCDPAKSAACLKQVNSYNAEQQRENQVWQDIQQKYNDAMKIYNRDVFIIANIAGIMVFLAGFVLLFAMDLAAQGVPIGIMIAGLYGIIYGYARGWGSTDDLLKFFIGLVIAALVIGGSIWLIQRRTKKAVRGNGAAG